MPTPEELAAQEAAAQAAADEAKKAEEAAVKPEDDATKAAEEAKRLEDEKKAAEEAAKAALPGPTATEGAEKRIRELVAKQREAERLADYYKGLAEGRTAKTPDAPVVPTKPKPPRPEDFEGEGPGKGYDAYLVALAEYGLEVKLEARRQTEEAERVRESVARSQQTFMERVNKAAETDPEILEIMKDPTLPVSPVMAEVIRESEVGPKILRFLSANRVEGNRIARLQPLAAARELGRIEAKILATPAPAPPNRISQAPEPVRPLTPAGVTEIDLDKVPIDDFMKKRNAQQYGAEKG